MTKRQVIVTGARAPVAIDFARSFAAAGHDVHLADSVTAHAARMALVGRGRVLSLPPARYAFDAYRAALTALLADHPDTILLPTCEEVFYVAEAAAQQGFSSQVLAPPPELLRQLHSKIEFPALVRSLGLHAPKTRAIASAGDAEALRKQAHELVLKPEFSRFGIATLIHPSSGVLGNLQATPTQRWAAQAFVPGNEICLWTATREGRVVASAAYRPLWRLGQSAAYAFEAIDCPAALDVARAIASATGATGQLSFDIIMTPQGHAVPIECNPRAISGVHLFAGRADLARAMLGEGPPVHATRGVSFLSPAMALLGGPQALMGGRLHELMTDMRRGQDALTRPGDRWPVVGALLDAARFAWTGWSRHTSPTQQTTDDIEWNGETIQ